VPPAPAALLALVATVTSLAGPATSAEDALPPGAGRTLLAEACMQCHQLRPILTQRKTEPAWRRTVNEMIWRGAPLLPGESDVLVRYLATSFGPSDGSAATGPRTAAAPAIDDPGARLLPPGAARAVVLEVCVGCHDLATTLMRRQTADQWRRSVDVMVRLGARLEPADIAAVANYLAGFLGPEPRATASRGPEGDRR
jgi:mono/diheme cytochrome c family protein